MHTEYSQSSKKRYSETGINFTQHRAAQAQHASKIYTSFASECSVLILFRIDYT